MKILYTVINIDNEEFSYHFKFDRAQQKALRLKEKFKNETFYVFHIPSQDIIWDTTGRSWL